MTRKENLLIETLKLRNQIAAVNGKEQTDIETYSKTWQFHNAVKESREYELKERIESLQKSLTATFEQKRIEDARNAYFATEEGAALKANLEQQLIDLRKEWDSKESEVIAELNTRIKALLGDQWALRSYGKQSISIGVLDTAKMAASENPTDNEFIFGQTFEVYYEPHDWRTGDKRFEVNIGTCGNHQLLPTEQAGSFAQYYIGIGLFHSNTKFLTNLKAYLFDALDEFDRLTEIADSLRNRLANPLVA